MTKFLDTDYDHLFRCGYMKQNNSIVQVEES